MRLKHSYEIVDMGNELLAVPVGSGAKEVKGIIKLNSAAAEIFQLIKTDTTEDRVVKELEAIYENDHEQITQYVKYTINSLRDNGLIDDRSGG